MAKKNQKILILDYDSDTTAAVGDIFSKHYDALTIASLEEASEKANDEKFDIIITGYVIPAVSGKKAISYLRNIKNAISKAEKAVQDKSAAAKKLLRKSQDKQDEYLDMLNEKIRAVEYERAALEQKLQSIMEEIDTARNSKTEAEEKVETVLTEKIKMEEEFAKLREEDVKVIDRLNNEINTLKEEIKNSASLAEGAYKEKAEMEEKLTKLQENWEKYVSG